MSYCPTALMEDIGRVSNDRSSNRDDVPTLQVPFPSLSLAHPPSDSEATVTTATTTTTTTSASMSTSPPKTDQLLHKSDDPPCSDGSLTREPVNVSTKMSSKRKRAYPADDDAEKNIRRCHRARAKSAVAPLISPSSLRALPDMNQPSASYHQQLPASSSNSNECERSSILDVQQEIEIDELDFNEDCGSDPMCQIKASLHRYVAAVKRRKKRLEEEKHQKKDNHAAKPAASSSSPGNGEHHNDDSTRRTHEIGEGSMNLPELKRKPIHTIMSWMDTFQDHEKIQLICLQSLPTILESPPNRLAAQADGLASIVLYDMAAFPTNSLLQLTAFHTLVLLLRPLGTSEGTVRRMKSHSSARPSDAARSSSGEKVSRTGSKSSAIVRSIDHRKHHHRHHHSRQKISINAVNRQQSQHPLLDAIHAPSWTENGVRVMLDSLRRFSMDRYLQAMGCWAMVNAALYPALKRSILRLGGVYSVTNAMMLHPNVEAVQFRGLFALINLVIPDNKTNKKEYPATSDGSSIHSHIYQIARLTILAMRNFHTNKSILNRGCLVLRNLSLSPAFVKILARTPGCADMLLHCRRVCGPRDVLVQRSARTVMILVQRAEAEENEGGSGTGGSALSIAFCGTSTERPKF
eukprot:CAMPEP_0172536612 /NCGR_PEP_ID=MMETSP1067-20121228/8346_1 /TAXON_ID=265564 ORGANISM="Thalassiosira punctigera, Strain Tpunct2005C2" /NCGR_SAMPLE_ID=MMETSP1067 /ASSEMBLY_ACC=CAM_ASM_000444 /LENGTH=633 /DNA_ID=CAMNT_0013321719 /DNA_START=376 /DNA_END=2277 /DNA_ORIENTATION=+